MPMAICPEGVNPGGGKGRTAATDIREPIRWKPSSESQPEAQSRQRFSTACGTEPQLPAVPARSGESDRLQASGSRPAEDAPG